MKIKSFAMLALSGLLAASCAYIAPAMADDANMGPSMQPPADSTPNSNAMQGLSQNDNQYGPSDNNSGTSDNMSDNSSNDQSTSNNNPSANPSDEGGPDTATGDDDY
jgi:hypothetical protein